MVVPPVLLEPHRSSPSAPISTSSGMPTRARMVCLGSIRSRGSHARRRRILSDDVHRFVLAGNLGQTFGGSDDPNLAFLEGLWLSASPKLPRPRPRLARVVADVCDL